MAYAKTGKQFWEILEEILVENRAAALYIKDIPHNLWAWYVLLIFIFSYTNFNRYAFSIARFSYNTSNIVESLNNKWGQIRFLPPLHLVDAIYTDTMKLVYDRAKEARQSVSSILANLPYKKFKERQVISKRYKVYESGN